MKIIAFIPVRGGSKSIPLKNIKPLCGKPLVYWSIEALEACDLVDEIVVATDSDEIWKAVETRHYKKITLYRRTAENATDTATTESVMIEYIQFAHVKDNTVFMLVQATSPLTETRHFTEALQMYCREKYDSVITCVRNKRFFWNEEGTSLNYDYRKRPRRQDFRGLLMENGAFYINKVVNILESENRLSGKIGIYEMPEYTATEIDEPDDWAIIENIMRRHVLSSKTGKKIKLFLSDVDGTLTDGGMYYSENGDELKKFNTRDGMGFQLLREAGIKTGIITGEDLFLNQRRANKLKVDYLWQGVSRKEKLEKVLLLIKELGITLKEVAYIGDDVNCLDLISSVGIAACPSDAHSLVKAVPAIHIMSKRGGEGCVREFAEFILNEQ